MHTPESLCDPGDTNLQTCNVSLSLYQQALHVVGRRCHICKIVLVDDDALTQCIPGGELGLLKDDHSCLQLWWQLAKVCVVWFGGLTGNLCIQNMSILQNDVILMSVLFTSTAVSLLDRRAAVNTGSSVLIMANFRTLFLG